MMNCCIRDAILFCARDAIYNREARRRFSANGFFFARIRKLLPWKFVILSFVIFRHLLLFPLCWPKNRQQYVIWSLFFLRRQWKFDEIFSIIWNLLYIKSSGRFRQIFVAFLENLTFVRYFWKNVYTISGKTCRKK